MYVFVCLCVCRIAGHFRFLQQVKMVFCKKKLIWLGVGFLNGTDAEIGYELDKKWWKNTESAQLCFCLQNFLLFSSREEKG